MKINANFFVNKDTEVNKPLWVILELSNTKP